MFVVAALSLLCMACCVVLARSPIRAALALIVALCCLAVLYSLLLAPFVSTMQILVYAGAIMVLFLFVIMLLNVGAETTRKSARLAMTKILGAIAAGYVVWQVLLANVKAPLVLGRLVDGHVKQVGYLLLTDYLLHFEAISVLLLVAVVSAVVLGSKRLI